MFKKIERTASLLAAGILFVLMLITFVDVVGRNVINRPLTGAAELTEILLAAMIFLMLPRVALRNQHIVIDLVENVVGPRTLKAMDIFAAVLSAVMFFLICYQMWILATRAAGYGDSTGALGIPIAPVLFCISVMSAVVGLASLFSVSAPSVAAASGLDGATDKPVVV